MKLGIFLKFVLFFVLLAIVLGAGGLYVYKKYRQEHYEAVASAQLATAVVGSAGILDQALTISGKAAGEALALYSMFPFVLCVELTSGEYAPVRWPPLPCDIIKEEKYPLDYSGVLAHGGSLRIYVSRQWVKEQVDSEVEIGFVALSIFLVLFVVGSGFVFRRVVGYPVSFLIRNLHNVSQDLSKQESIKKLTRDEIGELTDALNGLLQRIRGYQIELVRLANTDGLTGIYNRRTFFAKGEELLETPGARYFFMLIDLDYFKSVNDSYGHAVGDVVLELVGQMLQGAVRTGGTRLSDVVGRLGGEEFGVLLVAGDIETAMSIAERVRETLQNMVVETGGDPLTITGSFGLAELVPGESLDALYQRADQACYEAKDHGRNRVEVAST